MAPDEKRRQRAHVTSVSFACVCLSFDGGIAPAVLTQEETPKEILAVRVREQGYACERPIRAEKDAAETRPLATVWVLECSNARYRIVLHPDMAAEIQVLN